MRDEVGTELGGKDLGGDVRENGEGWRLQNRDKGNGGKAPSAMEIGEVVDSCVETKGKIGNRGRRGDAGDGGNREGGEDDDGESDRTRSGGEGQGGEGLE